MASSVFVVSRFTHNPSDSTSGYRSVGAHLFGLMGLIEHVPVFDRQEEESRVLECSDRIGDIGSQIKLKYVSGFFGQENPIARVTLEELSRVEHWQLTSALTKNSSLHAPFRHMGRRLTEIGERDLIPGYVAVESLKSSADPCPFRVYDGTGAPIGSMRRYLGGARASTQQLSLPKENAYADKTPNDADNSQSHVPTIKAVFACIVGICVLGIMCWAFFIAAPGAWSDGHFGRGWWFIGLGILCFFFSGRVLGWVLP
jgi:hypothetical protein